MRKCPLLGAAFLVSAAVPARAESEQAAPTLEGLRELIVRRGVPPRFVRIEKPGEGVAPETHLGPRPTPQDRDASSRAAGEQSVGRPYRASGPPRLVFWTRTRRLTQTVVIAVVGEGEARYVRIQSAGLARASAGHPRLGELLAYLLDRNFVTTGVAFARDAADGEIVLRAELAVGAGFSEGEFNRTLDALLRAADEEAPRLEAVLGGGEDEHRK